MRTVIKLTMKRMRIAKIIIAATAAIFLAACGLKDDLYIPVDQTEAEGADVPNAEEPEIEDETGPEDSEQFSEMEP